MLSIMAQQGADIEEQVFFPSTEGAQARRALQNLADSTWDSPDQDVYLYFDLGKLLSVTLLMYSLTTHKIMDAVRAACFPTEDEQANAISAVEILHPSRHRLSGFMYHYLVRVLKPARWPTEISVGSWEVPLCMVSGPNVRCRGAGSAAEEFLYIQEDGLAERPPPQVTVP